MQPSIVIIHTRYIDRYNIYYIIIITIIKYINDSGEIFGKSRTFYTPKWKAHFPTDHTKLGFRTPTLIFYVYYTTYTVVIIPYV